MLLWTSACFATANLQVTDVTVGWRGFVDTPTGTAFWNITAIGSDGTTLVYGGADTNGHGLFSLGSSSMAIITDEDIDVSFDRGATYIDRVFRELEVDGIALPVADVRGKLEIVGSDVPSPISPQRDESVPFIYIPDSATVEDLPVDFDLEFELFTDSSEQPAYRISGSGTGTASVNFNTIAPDHSGILQSGASYDLQVKNGDAGVVPEPASIAVWGILLMALFGARTGFSRQRKQN